MKADLRTCPGCGKKTSLETCPNCLTSVEPVQVMEAEAAPRFTAESAAWDRAQDDALVIENTRLRRVAVKLAGLVDKDALIDLLLEGE